MGLIMKNDEKIMKKILAVATDKTITEDELFDIMYDNSLDIMQFPELCEKVMNCGIQIESGCRKRGKTEHQTASKTTIKSSECTSVFNEVQKPKTGNAIIDAISYAINYKSSIKDSSYVSGGDSKISPPSDKKNSSVSTSKSIKEKKSTTTKSKELKLIVNQKEESGKEIFKCEIKENIGVISKSSKGWRKELNIVSWNEGIPKYDIREWSPDYDRMGKGVTFTKEELIKLRSILNEMKI